MIKKICDICGYETDLNFKNCKLMCYNNIKIQINVIEITKLSVPPIEEQVICRKCLLEGIEKGYELKE